MQHDKGDDHGCFVRLVRYFFKVRSVLSLILLLLLPQEVFAHRLDSAEQVWKAWVFSYGIMVPTLIFVVLYFRGMAKRRESGKTVSTGRMITYLSGMFCFVVALQSPIEPLSDHFLFIHQIEHMLLRSVGPLLVILSMPLALLLQGLPGFIRHKIIAPLVRNRILQALFNFFSNPFVASLLFVAAQVVWQIPPIHDFAVSDASWHDFMHFSMIWTGFFFWWLICDPRQGSAQISYGMRLIILWIITVPNTLLGAIITLDKDVLYKVYDVLQGQWNIEKLLDQQLGGIVIWGPDGMMGFVGTGVVFLLWLRREKSHGSHMLTVQIAQQ